MKEMCNKNQKHETGNARTGLLKMRTAGVQYFPNNLRWTSIGNEETK